jgi:hypothetical protein
MATLPHDTYASPGIPLWASAQSGQAFASPSIVEDSLVTPTKAVITRVGAEEGSLEYNSIPAGTPYNIITMDRVGGTYFTQNTIETLRTQIGETKVTGELNVYNPTTGSTMNLAGNKINYNNIQQVVMDETFTQIGDKSYGDSNGWNVYNTSSYYKSANLQDNTLQFWTQSNTTPTTLTYNFSSDFVPNAPSTNLIFNNIHDTQKNSLSFQDFAGTLDVAGDSNTYYLHLENTGITNTEIGFGWSVYGELGFSAGLMPFIWSMTMPDPGAYQWEIRDITQPEPLSRIVQYIRKTAGICYFDVYGGGTIQFSPGDVLQFYFKMFDFTTANLFVSLNQQVVGGTSFEYTESFTFTPRFQTQDLSPVPPGTQVETQMLFFTQVEEPTSFSGFSWSEGGGGLYPIAYTLITPSGTSPTPDLLNNAFVINGAEMYFRPFQEVSPGQQVLLRWYAGGNGAGTYQLWINGQIWDDYVNTDEWAEATASYTSSGSDDIYIRNTTPTASVLSIQNVRWTWTQTIDVPVAYLTASGTGEGRAMDIGTAGSSANMSLYVSSTRFLKPIDMNAGNISNVSNITAVDVNATNLNGDGTGNLTLNTDIDANANYISNVDGFAMLDGGNGSLNMNGQVISNATHIYGDLTHASGGLNIDYAGQFLWNSSGQDARIYPGGSLSFNIVNNNGSLVVATSGAGHNITIASPSANIYVGLDGDNVYVGNGVNNVYASNVNTISGKASSGGNLTNFDTINNSPAVATGIIYYTANFGGYRVLTMPLPPKKDSANNLSVFGGGLTGDNFVSASAVTIPVGASFNIQDPAGTFIVSTNNATAHPKIFDISTYGFSPTSTTQVYQLFPTIT